jgi:uncharacterized lipoprotein YddW (UPF0748 family)
MKKRDFVKVLSAGTIGVFALSALSLSCTGSDRKRGLKNWAWIHPTGSADSASSIEEWKKLFGNLKKWGIDYALLLTETNSIIEQVLPVAKQAGIELHAWIIALNWPDKNTMKEHPEWYVVNGNGESSVDKPAYVDDYNWLCPGNPEVLEFMQKRIRELCAYNELAGVHLDYIRYPDVVLAPEHKAKYNIPQDDLVHPQFDYCYCEVCRSRFKKLSGMDPLTIEDQATNEAWLNFRFDSVTNLVNELYDTVHKSGKILSAAVFPTPNLSKFRVRQDWLKWKLDYVMPMLYQRYEGQPVEWIETATREGVEALAGRIPLFSGLHLALLNPQEFGLATSLSLKAGASGIVLFPGNAMNEDYYKYMKEGMESHK